MRAFTNHVTINLYNMKGLSLQNTTIMDCSSIYPTNSTRYRKGSHYASHSLTASITLEAAILFPIFLLAIAQLLSVFLIYLEYSRQLITLHQGAKALGLISYIGEDMEIMIPYVSDTDKNEDIIDLYIIRDFTPGLMLTGQKVITPVRGRVRSWTGYDNIGASAQEKYVYVTEYGSVYHTSRGCSHLQLSIQKRASKEIPEARNASGAIYTECDYCSQEDSLNTDSLYITEDGERYHYSLDCPGLTRIIRMIKLTEADEYAPCSQCVTERD